jgi:Uma2 family endonuclease
MNPLSERAPAGRIVLTYEDYVGLPDDGNRYEILDGELYVTPAPVPLHQRVSRNLQRILDRHVVERGLGEILDAPIDLILATTTVAQPDLLFIRAGRDIVTHRAVEAPPDLVVEILSPSSVRQDRATKATLYARFGIPHYWIVDPAERRFEMHELDGAGYRLSAEGGAADALRSALFPALEIRLADVWA